MGWFGRLFGRFDPPTAKQLRFAEALGITVTKRMSRQDVSAAIDKKKAEDPKGHGKAVGTLARGSRRAGAVVASVEGGLDSASAADGAWLKTPEGRETASLYKRWQRIAESEPYGIFVYRVAGTGRVEVDVARVAGVDCDHDATGRARVLLDVALPQTVRDAVMRMQVLEWSRDLGWFPAEDVLIWHKLPSSFEDVDGCIVDGNAESEDRRRLARYEAALKKGRELAGGQGLKPGR